MRLVLNYILETLNNLWGEGVGKAGGRVPGYYLKEGPAWRGMGSKPLGLDVGQRLIGFILFG
jgi:hypothetical protein